MSFLLGFCNISFNLGYLKGSITTSNQIQSTIPLWVYLMSIFYTAPGQDVIRPRFIKLLFSTLGLFGMYILISHDAKQSSLLLEGAMWNTVCVIGYAVYCIALNTVVTDNFNYAMFLGFLGIINIVWMTPAMVLMHIWDIQPWVTPTAEHFFSELAYSFLCTGCFEFCWAQCATALGPIMSTIGFTMFMLPACLVLDFVIWPDPN